MWPLLEIGTEELVIELIVAAGLLAAAAAPFAIRAAATRRRDDPDLTSGRGDLTPFSLITLLGAGIAAVVAVALVISVVARAVA